MILRTWRGWTRPEDADAYVAYLLETGLKEYRETPGNRGAHPLRRDDGDRTEFVTVSFWESIEASRASPATTSRGPCSPLATTTSWSSGRRP